MTKKRNRYFPFLLEAIQPEAYGEVNITKPSEKGSFFFDTFRDEYGWEIDRKGEQSALAGYLQGLPSTIAIPFYNSDVLELARNHGDLLPTDGEKKEERILENYWNFLAWQLIRLRNSSEKELTR